MEIDGEAYFVLIYADDIVLPFQGVGIQTRVLVSPIVLFAPSAEAMNRNLEALRAACENMNLNINLKKTEFMIIPPASTSASVCNGATKTSLPRGHVRDA